MPRSFGRNLQMCFANIMHPISSSQSKAQENNNQNPSKISSILINNFNSLYDDPNNYNHATTLIASNMPPPSPQSTPNFTTVYKSERFFFSSPGHSNSITESATSSLSSSFCSSSLAQRESEVVDGGVTVLSLSPDPYLDFRRSMQEMVEARGLVDVRQNIDYLHELLACYLSLSPKSTHKFIVGAFANLLVSLMTTSTVEAICRNGGGCAET